MIIPCEPHLYVCALAYGPHGPPFADMVRIPIIAWSIADGVARPLTSDGPVETGIPWILYDDKLGQFLAKPGNINLTWNQAKEYLEQLYALP
jgi:hypothetical protein